jgi:hypothetical protein
MGREEGGSGRREKEEGGGRITMDEKRLGEKRHTGSRTRSRIHELHVLFPNKVVGVRIWYGWGVLAQVVLDFCDFCFSQQKEGFFLLAVRGCEGRMW